MTALHSLLVAVSIGLVTPLQEGWAAVNGELSPMPEYRVAHEDWGNAKQLVANGEWRTWLASREKFMHDWIEGPQDNLGWIAGSQQDWFAKSTGAHQPWRTDEPIPTSDPSATNTRTRRGAWVSYRRAYNFDRIQEAARIFRLTGNTLMRDWAAGQLDFYADSYRHWPLQNWNGRARMMGQSLDEATSCGPLLDAVRLLRGAVPDQRVEAWRRQLFQPMAANLEASYQGDNNISLWTRVAMAQIALEFEDEVLLGKALNGDRGLKGLMARNISNDGFWKEGSLSYQAYVVRAMTTLLQAAALKHRQESVSSQAALTSTMLLTPIGLRFPDGTVPAIGDSRVGAPAIERELFREVRRILPTPIGAIEATLKKSWDSLLDPPLTPAGQTLLPPVTTRHFSSLRSALLKTGNWQVFLHYGQATGFHAQAEALNVDIAYAGQYLFRDPGTVAYGSDLHQNFYRTPAAHAVPVIDGIGQEGWSEGQLDSLTPTVIAATQGRYNRLATAKRKLGVAGETLVDQLTLSANDNANHRLGFIVTTPCSVELPAKTSLMAPAAETLPAGPGFQYWQVSGSWRAKKNWEAIFRCGDKNFGVAFALPGPHRLVAATVPDTLPPGKRTALYFEIDGSEATLVTQMKPAADTIASPIGN